MFARGGWGHVRARGNKIGYNKQKANAAPRDIGRLCKRKYLPSASSTKPAHFEGSKLLNTASVCCCFSEKDLKV